MSRSNLTPMQLPVSRAWLAALTAILLPAASAARAAEEAVPAGFVAEAPSLRESWRDSAFALLPERLLLKAAPPAERSDLRTAQRRRAVARVMAELYRLARLNRHRRSPEIWARCARLAEQLNCPVDFTASLHALANPRINANERLSLLRLHERIFLRERLNSLALRQYVESLPQDDLLDAAAFDELPLGALFLRVEITAGGETVNGRIDAPSAELLIALSEEALEALRQAHDAAGADAAAEALMPLLVSMAVMPLMPEGRSFAPETSEALQRRARELMSEIRVELARAVQLDSRKLTVAEALFYVM